VKLTGKLLGGGPEGTAEEPSTFAPPSDAVAPESEDDDADAPSVEAPPSELESFPPPDVDAPFVASEPPVPHAYAPIVASTAANARLLFLMRGGLAATEVPSRHDAVSPSSIVTVLRAHPGIGHPLG
jgi:hypothetical protein